MISETVRAVKIELHGDWDYCGGDNVQIHIIQGAREGKTNVVYDPYLGQTYCFELGTCKSTTFHVDTPNINFKIITTTWDDLCPRFVTIYMNGGAQFWSGELDHWHDKKDNDEWFTATYQF